MIRSLLDYFIHMGSEVFIYVHPERAGSEMVTGSDAGDEGVKSGKRRSAQGHRHAAWRRKLHRERIEKKNQEEEE
jgi:hypothetical protein